MARALMAYTLEALRLPYINLYTSYLEKTYRVIPVVPYKVIAIGLTNSLHTGKAYRRTISPPPNIAMAPGRLSFICIPLIWGKENPTPNR
jgi:hypothetical protein